MRSGSVIALCVFLANAACDQRGERPPPPMCCGTLDPGVYGGSPLPPTGGTGGGAGSGPSGDEPVTLEGEVRILNDIARPTFPRFEDEAALLVEGANGDVSGEWSGFEPKFSIEGVKRGPVVWTQATPALGDALRSVGHVDTTSPIDGVVTADLALALESEIDAAYASLVSPIERSTTAAQVILVAQRNGAPAAGVQAFSQSAEAIIYVENGVFSDMATSTDMSGVVILANVPGGAWPETTVPVTLSGVQGAYNVVVVSGGVTIARLRAE